MSASIRMRSIFGFTSVPIALLSGLFFVGLALLGFLEGGEMTLPVVPVAPESAAGALAVLGASGILAGLLALRDGKLARLLLLIWWLCVFVLLAAAVFRGSYRFDGLDDFQKHILLVLAALVLSASSWVRFRTESVGDY